MSGHQGLLFDVPDGFAIGSVADLDHLLRTRHYLGPLTTGTFELIVVDFRGGVAVGGMVWRKPSPAALPNDGTWLELSRWILTPDEGPNAGSRMHAWVVRYLRRARPEVTTLVSYSDPSVGHTGALYRACNWLWRPTWHRLRPPPTGNGSWDGGRTRQEPKDRWVFELRRDPRRAEILDVKDSGAERAFAAAGSVPPWKVGR